MTIDTNLVNEQKQSSVIVPEKVNVPEQKKSGGIFSNLVSSFVDTLNKEIADISNVEIVTAIGNPKTNVNPDAEMMVLGLKAEEVKILARTRIELDGDIMVLLPTDGSGNLSINKEVMEIHKQNVDTAVANWNNFMRNMLDGLDTLIRITGVSKEKVFNFS